VFFATHSSNVEVTEKAEDVEEEEHEQMVEEIEEILDIFGNSYMNKHLVYNILELAVVRLVPEMRVSGVGDLLAERGVVVGGKCEDVDEVADERSGR
jgi:hypothetical protein